MSEILIKITSDVIGIFHYVWDGLGYFVLAVMLMNMTAVLFEQIKTKLHKGNNHE